MLLENFQVGVVDCRHNLLLSCLKESGDPAEKWEKWAKWQFCMSYIQKNDDVLLFRTILSCSAAKRIPFCAYPWGLKAHRPRSVRSKLCQDARAGGQHDHLPSSSQGYRTGNGCVPFHPRCRPQHLHQLYLYSKGLVQKFCHEQLRQAALQARNWEHDLRAIHWDNFTMLLSNSFDAMIKFMAADSHFNNRSNSSLFLSQGFNKFGKHFLSLYHAVDSHLNKKVSDHERPASLGRSSTSRSKLRHLHFLGRHSSPAVCFCHAHLHIPERWQTAA